MAAQESDIVLERSETESADSVRFAEFALEQFRAPLTPDGTPRNGVELLAVVESQEAAQLGKEVFELHKQQRYPFWYTDVESLPGEPVITRAAVISLRSRDKVKTPKKFTRDNEQYYTLPLAVRDTAYVLEDTDGHIFLFTDHTNSVIPTNELYREIARRKKIDISSTIFTLFNTYSHSAEHRGGKDREEFVRYMETHAEVAARHGIQINVQKFTEYFEKGYFSMKSPMHCYLSGVRATDTNGNLTSDGQFVLRNAIRRMRHQYPGPISEVKLGSLVAEQCETASGVFNMLRYDVLPVTQSARTFKTELASFLVQNYLHPENRIAVEGKRSLAKLTDAQLATFIVQLASQLTSEADGRDFLMSMDNAVFHQRQLAGLLDNVASFGFESMDQVYDLMQHIPMKKSEKKRFLRDLSMAVAAVELSKQKENKTQNMSYEARTWLDLGSISTYIGNIYGPKQLLGNEFARKSGGFIGQMFSEWRPRLEIPSNADTWIFPWMSDLEFGRSAQSHPFWSAWIDIGVEVKDHPQSPLDIIPALTSMRQFIHTPFWKNQLEQAQAEPVDSFLHWMKTTIQEYAQKRSLEPKTMGHSDRVLMAKEINRLLRKTRYTQNRIPYSAYGGAIEDAAQSVQFALQMEQAYRDIRVMGYPAVPAKAPTPHVSIGADYIPFHLAAMHTREFQKKSSDIRYGLRENRGGEDRHLGIRLREIAEHPDMDIHCWGYLVPLHRDHKTEYTEWKFRDESRRIVLEWLASSGLEITPGYNTAQDDAVGAKFYSWIRREIATHWNRFQEEPVFENKRAHLQAAITYAGALLDLNEADITNYHGSAMDQARYLEKYLTEAYDLYYTQRIVPFGEVHPAPGKPIVLRAVNMAGKSTIMRGILYAALLQNQGLPQTGDADVPFGLQVDTPIGTESQGVDKSLITSAIVGLHRIAGITGDQRDAAHMAACIWAIDEMGRRTNKHFGETLFMSSLLLSSLIRGGSNIVVSASHYHDLDRFTPLLTALGITPQWHTVDSNHVLREVLPDERTKSLAIASLLPFVGPEGLELWPDEGDRKELGIPYNPEVYKSEKVLSRGRVEEISYADIFGVSREERHNSISAIIGEQDTRMTDSFEETFLRNIDGGQTAQKLFDSLRRHDVNSEKKTLEIVLALADFYNPPDGTVDRENFAERERHVFTRLGLVKDPKQTLSNKSWRRKANAALRRLNTEYRKAIRSYNKSMKDSGFRDFSSKGMLRRIDFSTLYNPGHALQDQIAFVIGTLSFVKTMSGKTNKYAKVRYTNNAVVDMKDAFNPFLQKGQVVPNDVHIDFSDGAAGTFISGENYSGKSNYLRTIGIALWLARTTGFAPAAKIRMNKRVLPLSLTQPVSDEVGASSMMVESRDRLVPVFLASHGVHGNLVVSLLDEPAAPTSPEDATKANMWLFRNYIRSRGRAKLLVSSHSNDVPSLLAQEKIPVELAAFRLLSKTEKFKKIPGTVDSNALEVAKELGLHPLIYEFCVQVHEYIKAVDAGAVSQDAVQQYAARVMELLTEIESLPQEAKRRVTRIV